MSKAWGVTNFSDVVEFCFDWKIVNLSRYVEILYAVYLLTTYYMLPQVSEDPPED